MPDHHIPKQLARTGKFRCNIRPAEKTSVQVNDQCQDATELCLPKFLPISNDLIILTPHSFTGKVYAELPGVCVFFKKVGNYDEMLKRKTQGILDLKIWQPAVLRIVGKLQHKH